MMINFKMTLTKTAHTSENKMFEPQSFSVLLNDWLLVTLA